MVRHFLRDDDITPAEQRQIIARPLLPIGQHLQAFLGFRR